MTPAAKPEEQGQLELWWTPGPGRPLAVSMAGLLAKLSSRHALAVAYRRTSLGRGFPDLGGCLRQTQHLA